MECNNTTMVGDGDSSTYGTIKNTYPGKTVEKGECIGHVQKRVGKNSQKTQKKNTQKKPPGHAIPIVRQRHWWERSLDP